MKIRLAFCLAAVALLAGCGAKEHYVTKAPDRSLSSFPSVQAKPFAVSADVSGSLNDKDRKDLNELAGMIGPRVAEILSSRKMSGSSEAPQRLIIEGTIVRYVPGNQALRYLISFGAGSSRMVADVHFKDADGKDIGSGDFVGGVTAGAFGGSKKDAVERMAMEIADYVSGKYSAVKP